MGMEGAGHGGRGGVAGSFCALSRGGDSLSPLATVRGRAVPAPLAAGGTTPMAIPTLPAAPGRDRNPPPMRPIIHPSCWRSAAALGRALAVFVFLELPRGTAAEPVPLSPAALAAAPAANAAAQAYYDPAAAARTHYEAGRLAEAFDGFLTVPGLEHGALAVARSEARTYLARLATLAGKAPPATLQLLEGDLRLLLNEPAPALE